MSVPPGSTDVSDSDVSDSDAVSCGSSARATLEYGTHNSLPANSTNVDGNTNGDERNGHYTNNSASFIEGIRGKIKTIKEQFGGAIKNWTDKKKVVQKHTNPATATCMSNTTLHNQWWYIGIVAATAVVAFSLLYYRSTQGTPTPVPCYNRFLGLATKYPNLDPMLWKTLAVGVEKAIDENSGEPTTVLFLHNSSSVGESMLTDVTQIALECLESESAIWRSSDDFRSLDMAADYHKHLEQYSSDLKAQGVLVVRDLDQVPPRAAQLFFTICDEFEPLVRKAVTFFTIDITQQSKREAIRADHSATYTAERILKDVWKRGLNSDALDPLVVRLTGSVFTINEDSAAQLG